MPTTHPASTNTPASDARYSDPTRTTPTTQGIIEALEDRKMEAEQRGWLGELEGIDISLNAAREKLARMARQVSLGVPSFPSGPKD
ncbi:hypothetical protein [Arthrobacter sp. D5-1]|uniref:hypothetical protein n=1 Tax=Arthrobacter sp. D5-1 TaxID=1477518 RepID=UPI001A995966|nr:hypothetical protein [Arthrobacter sp. D5-1]